MIRFFRLATLSCFVGAFGASGAHLFAAPAKSKTKVKTSLSKSPVQGLMLQGEGVCTFNATFTKGSSNLSSTQFKSIGRRKFGIISSESEARVSEGYSIVRNSIQGRGNNDTGPPRSEENVNRGRPESAEDRIKRLQNPSGAFSLEFASYGGFRKGQTIPITPSKAVSNRAPFCFVTYRNPASVEGQALVDGNGRSRRNIKNVERTWVAASGSLVVQSVSAQKITFTLRNVRFTAPARSIYDVIEPNSGRGSFVLNGSGQSTFNETD